LGDAKRNIIIDYCKLNCVCLIGFVTMYQVYRALMKIIGWFNFVRPGLVWFDLILFGSVMFDWSFLYWLFYLVLWYLSLSLYIYIYSGDYAVRHAWARARAVPFIKNFKQKAKKKEKGIFSHLNLSHWIKASLTSQSLSLRTALTLSPSRRRTTALSLSLTLAADLIQGKQILKFYFMFLFLEFRIFVWWLIS
jgi:hypothetical protein